ncbi:2'-5' RNA ligase family protein [Nonomuraea sp. NPDC050451]|uniref:2'-5' RNA ligase family protein n=1 Tax=Nonomuraea sp. NPDC050451 TaxID=3364364 RepID=UPI00379F5002
MSDFADFQIEGRAALLAGRATHDSPMVEGARRWGAAAVLRPSGEVLDRLAALAGTIEAPGHWVHGRRTLHVTLRSLEPYRDQIPAGDPLREIYRDALAEAAEGVGPARVRLAGVSPHPGGVLVCGHPEDDTLVRLWERFARAMASRGVRDLEHGRVRDRWYVSLVHFAGPLADARPIVDWCDAHADVDFGLAELDTAEIVQFVLADASIHVKALEEAQLGRA